MTTQDMFAVLWREALKHYRVWDRMDKMSYHHHTADVLRRAAKRLARLADDELADRVAYDCSDLHHNEGTCMTCSARAAGIDAYRRAVGT